MQQNRKDTAPPGCSLALTLNPTLVEAVEPTAALRRDCGNMRSTLAGQAVPKSRPREAPRFPHRVAWETMGRCRAVVVDEQSLRDTPTKGPSRGWRSPDSGLPAVEGHS